MRRGWITTIVAVAATLVLHGPAPAQQQPPPTQTSCVSCHASDLFEGEELAIVEGFGHDVHGEFGLSCHDCHGGNPDPALFEDMELAMDEGYAANPYRGAPSRAETPVFCGRCHSDAGYMRRFRPDIRVDQVQEYLTSRHGQALAAGDENVATCSSCHGVHGMRAIDDPQSRVYPTRVAETCSQCHGDANRMSGYETDDGRALPVDQYALWQQSVHAQAMFGREDLTAPTCNDCHGNHGAAPPGVESVNFVCGQCHGREASLFRQSPKREAFEEHNEYLADAGPEGCAACHTEPEPQAAVKLTHLGECASCHGNHGIVRPSLAMLSPLPDTPCSFCHEGVGAAAGDAEAVVAAYAEQRDALLAEAASQGIEGDARFDWLIDQARALPQHGGSGPEATDAGREFTRLYDKFRLGKTHYTYVDPASGEEVSAAVLRCASCHGTEELLGEDAHGYRVSQTVLDAMRELTGQTAAAERSLLRARRRGVETREALLSIDQAVDAQIGLEVLLHSFDVSADGPLVAQHAEGMEHAAAATLAGREALQELASRYRGLYVALGVILILLVALGLKIRQVSEASRD